MSTPPPISLDKHWFFRYFPVHTEDIVDGHSGSIASITNWIGLEFADSIVWAWRPFRLDATNVCVRYYHSIEALPQATGFAVNEHQFDLPIITFPLNIDVTDFVTLGENIIAIRVSNKGRFGQIRLLPIACDEL